MKTDKKIFLAKEDDFKINKAGLLEISAFDIKTLTPEFKFELHKRMDVWYNSFTEKNGIEPTPVEIVNEVFQKLKESVK